VNLKPALPVLLTTPSRPQTQDSSSKPATSSLTAHPRPTPRNSPDSSPVPPRSFYPASSPCTQSSRNPPGCACSPTRNRTGYIPRNIARKSLLQRLVVESGEILLPSHGRRDRGERNQEVAPKVELQAVDEPNDAREGHGLDVKVEPVEARPAHHVVEQLVVGLEAGVVAVKRGKGALVGAAEHAKDFDAVVLQDTDFLPNGLVLGGGVGVVVEGDVRA